MKTKEDLFRQAVRESVRKNNMALLNQGWDMTRCVNGVPANFDTATAEAVVENAAQTKPVCVRTLNNGEMREAYYYVYGGDFRLCVVAHVHSERGVVGGWTPGHSFITGWMNWEMDTPWSIVDDLNGRRDFGTVPSAADQLPQ